MIYWNRDPSRYITRKDTSSPSTNADEGVDNVRGKIASAIHDDLLPETDGQMAGSRSPTSNDQGTHMGPFMLPSRLRREGNEWGDV